MCWFGHGWGFVWYAQMPVTSLAVSLIGMVVEMLVLVVMGWRKQTLVHFECEWQRQRASEF